MTHRILIRTVVRVRYNFCDRCRTRGTHLLFRHDEGATVLGGLGATCAVTSTARGGGEEGGLTAHL